MRSGGKSHHLLHKATPKHRTKPARFGSSAIRAEPQVADIDRGDAEAHPLGKPNGTGDLRIGVGDGRG
jgi:hypothetical protein